jgi:FSR family fosmidomycin resistance protein-like MFS transporter
MSTAIVRDAERVMDRLTLGLLSANAVLVPLALVLYLPTSLMVVMGQEYLPGRVGTASGVTLGLAVSVGGVVTPALGFVADQAGLRTALLLLVVVPVIAAPLAFSLPRRSN